MLHRPQEYVRAIGDAAREGYDVLVIDSLSHAWNGREGALELVDKAAKKSRSGNSYMAWRDVTPLHNQLVDAILTFPGHIIATLRAKTEYVLETNAKGQQVPRKVGMAPIQRDGLEYEFDIVADLDVDNTLIVSKSRCPALSGAVVTKPGPEFATSIREWLSDGDAPAEHAKPPIRDYKAEVTGSHTSEEVDAAKREKERQAAHSKAWIARHLPKLVAMETQARFAASAGGDVLDEAQRRFALWLTLRAFDLEDLRGHPRKQAWDSIRNVGAGLGMSPQETRELMAHAKGEAHAMNADDGEPEPEPAALVDAMDEDEVAD